MQLIQVKTIFMLALWLYGVALVHSETVRINEVMASNQSTIPDEDGDFEDWIELYNYGAAIVDLSEWGLSEDYDNPFRWTFPAGTTVWPGEHLLVWASGKDRATPAKHLVPLIGANTMWRYHVGEDPPINWTSPSFDDSGWLQGAAPFGVEGTDNVATVLSSSVTRAQFRAPLDVPTLDADWSNLTITVESAWDVTIHLNDEKVVTHAPIPQEDLILWVAASESVVLREAEDEFFVTQWSDLSGQGNHLTNPAEAAQPRWVTSGWNGLPAVQFDGTSQFLLSPTFATGDEVTLIVVARPESGPAWGRLFAKGGSAAGIQIQTSSTGPSGQLRVDTSGDEGGFNQIQNIPELYDGTWQQLMLSLSGAQSSGYLDWVQLFNRTFEWGDGIANDAPFVLGRSYGGSGALLQGDIAEVLLYDRLLTTEEVQQVESYLGDKYLGESTSMSQNTHIIDASHLDLGTHLLAVDVSSQSLESPLYLDIIISVTRDGYDFHTSYSIDSAGEEVILTRPDGMRVDELPPTEIPRNISVGRVEGEGDAWFYFDEPTPGKGNAGKAYLGILDPPEFSHPGGFYSTDVELVLTHADGGLEIVYSLDGSEPHLSRLGGEAYSVKNTYRVNESDEDGSFLTYQMSSQVYYEPLSITDRSPEPYILAGINTLVREDSRLPNGNLYKGTTVRARAVHPDYLPSRIITHTYFISPQGGSHYELPVISIATDASGLFGYDEGLFVPGQIYDDWLDGLTSWTSEPSWRRPANYFQRGSDWERVAHVEFFEPGNGLAFSGDMGIRVHGGITRGQAQRKSIRFYARNHLGLAPVQYPLFPELTSYDGGGREVTEFHRFLIRNSGNDWGRTLYRDAYLQSLIDHWPIEKQAYRPAIHFINGEYWGVNNLRERIDAQYIATHYDVNPDDVVILARNALLDTGTKADRDEFVQVANYAWQNDLSNKEHYDWISERVDIQNLITSVP